MIIDYRQLTPWLLAIWLITAIPFITTTYKRLNHLIEQIDKVISTVILMGLTLLLITEVKLCYT